MINIISCPSCKYKFKTRKKKPKNISKSVYIILKRQQKEIKRMKNLCPSNRRNYMIF